MPGTAVANRENGKKGGRPKGSFATKLTRRKASELYHDSRSPLDVMIDNMNFWWDKSKNASERLDKLMMVVEHPEFLDEVKSKLKKAGSVDPLLEVMKEIRKTSSQLVAYREKAQNCAVDAAPYCHPKFTSISWEGPVQENEVIDLSPQLNGRISVTSVLDATISDADSKRRSGNGNSTVVEVVDVE